MLGILFTILKIIGIILLTFLLLILGILLILLLVPVRYHVEGEFTEQKQCRGTVTWFFKLVSVPISLDKNGVDVTIKIFGREWGKSSGKSKKNKRAGMSKKQKNVKKAPPKSEKTVQETSQSEDVPNGVPEMGDTGSRRLSEKKVASVAETVAGNPAAETKTAGMDGIISKIYGKIESIIEKIKDICKKIKDLYSNAEALNEKKNKILDFFCEEEAFEAKNRTIEIFKKLLKHILPYRIVGNVHFGMESPDTTGQIYAVICLFYDKYANTLDLQPDFEQKIFEGNLEFWGRIRLINLVYYAICLVRIKKLREFISFVRNL